MTQRYKFDKDAARQIVRQNLDAAKENDYLGSDGTAMNDWSDEDIALDMIAYAEDCNDVEDPQELIPHIAEWRRDHPNH